MTTGRPEGIQGMHIAGTVDRKTQAKVTLEQLASPYLEGIVNKISTDLLEITTHHLVLILHIGDIPLQKFVRWETQRGCPFSCDFCQHRESGDHLTKKFFHVSRLAKEIEMFCTSNIVSDIAVLDPVFNSGPHYKNILQSFIDYSYSVRISYLVIRFRGVVNPLLGQDFIAKPF